MKLACIEFIDFHLAFEEQQSRIDAKVKVIISTLFIDWNKKQKENARTKKRAPITYNIQHKNPITHVVSRIYH